MGGSLGRDPWQGKVLRAYVLRTYVIECADCDASDSWSVDPATRASAERFFRQAGWRRLSDGLWRCRKHVSSAQEHIKISRAVVMVFAKGTVKP